MRWNSWSTNPFSMIELLIFSLLVLVNANDDFYDDVGNDWCGDCITTGGPQVRKQCQFPFTINGEVFDKCLKRRRQGWWCPTQLNSSNNVLSDQWGLCNACCPKEYINEILYLKEHNKTTDAQKLFCEIQNLDDKKEIMLDVKITAIIAKELFESEHCSDNAALIDGNDENDAIAKKLKENCDESCLAEQENGLELLEIAKNKTVNYFENQEEETNIYLKETSLALEAVSKLAVDYKEDVVRPDTVKQDLVWKIGNASQYLTPAQRAQMNKAVSGATSFDPLWTTQYNEIVASTKRELRIKKREYLKKKKINKGLKNKAVNYFGNVKAGFSGMSKTEKFSKANTALSGIIGAADKFKSGDDKLIVSGVMDVTNAIANFLPPPASTVTESLSGILEIFGVGGGPSTEDIIKEEFQKMKDFTSRKFDQQTKFIAGEFADQKKFIKRELKVQNDFIDQRIGEVTKQIADLTDFIQDEFTSQTNLTLELFTKEKAMLLEQKEIISVGFQNLEDSLTENIEELKEFILNEKMIAISSKAKSVLVEIYEKFTFLKSGENANVQDHEADAIKQEIAVMATSSKVADIRYSFEDLCVNVNNQLINQCTRNNILEKKMCTMIAYSYFSIEKYRDMTLIGLVSLLQKTKYRVGLNPRYLEVQNLRKQNIKQWISKVFVKEVACPVFKSETQYWEKQEHMNDVLDYFEYVDPTLKKNMTDLNLDECIQLQNSAREECCNCSVNGSNSLLCTNGQCDCKNEMTGLKCEQCKSGYYSFPQCLECGCNKKGSFSNSCNDDGICECKEKYTSTKCFGCIEDHFGPNCNPCNCNSRGRKSSACNANNGRCDCKTGFDPEKGRQCQHCLPGYYGPTCKECNCYPNGRKSSACNASNGQCDCKTGFDPENGKQCQHCLPGHYGPTCKDPCDDYKTFKSHKRIRTYSNVYNTAKGDKSGCSGFFKTADEWNGPGYYRFTGGAGTKLATSRVERLHCGTYDTGYLKEGTSALPSSPGDEVEATVCFYVHKQMPCTYPTTIKIKKCRNFWIFKLPEIRDSCLLGYCGQH